MSDLKITIKGRAGSGKSTLAELISDYLDVLGFGVTVDDQDIAGNDEDWDDRLARRVESLRNRETEVLIETKQVRRTNESISI